MDYERHIMKDVVPKEYHHMIWVDECGDEFLLLKYAEVFKRSDEVLRLHIFTPKNRLLLQKMGVILNEWRLDDGLAIVEIDKANLMPIIKVGAFKRRPDTRGKWVQELQKTLAHKIYRVLPPEERKLNRE